MSNYQLTTDLIADCMALIPQNLERLNESHLFEIKKYDSNLIEFKDFTFCNEREDEIYSTMKIDSMPEILQVAFFSHCLRTIPEFQVKNPKYKKFSTIDERRGDYIIQKWAEIDEEMGYAHSMLIDETYLINHKAIHWKKQNNAKAVDCGMGVLATYLTDETPDNIQYKSILIEDYFAPKTIWQATLFGNGTFPQTLEELCESYKNVMSK